MLSNIENKIEFFEHLQNDYENNIVYRLLVSTLDDQSKDLLYTTLSRLNGNIEEALKRFKRQCARNGVMQEVRKREHYEKPSVKRKKKSEAARKRKF